MTSESFFAKLAPTWWRETGEMSALHKINQGRMTFIREQVTAHFQLPDTLTPFSGLTMLDMGCGAGILAESLCRLGATVTGVDCVEEVIREARAHGAAMELGIDYRVGSVDDLSLEPVDVCISMEVLEHVDDWKNFLKKLPSFLKPGGLLLLSTLNRTALSYLLGIVAAERILKWVPRGTHAWHQFLKPSEVAMVLQEEGLSITKIQGLSLDIKTGQWVLSSNLEINYLLAATLS